MRVRNNFFSILFCLMATTLMTDAMGQALTGLVKNEKGYIVVSSDGYTGMEGVALAWKMPLQQLLGENPGVQTGNFTGTSEILIPAAGLLRDSACTGCVPLFHRVRRGEALYSIGRCYGQIPVWEIKQRNHLRGETIQPGRQLLLGYIAIPNPGKDDAVNMAENTVASQTGEIADLPKDTVTGHGRQQTEIPGTQSGKLTYIGLGVYEVEFQQSLDAGVRKTGKAAAFKSESGWKDGRFYVLCSKIKQGVVVRVFHPRSGKTLYARVVGPLPEIKQNNGLDYRLSNAAAAIFGEWNENEVFDLEMDY